MEDLKKDFILDFRKLLDNTEKSTRPNKGKDVLDSLSERMKSSNELSDLCTIKLNELLQSDKYKSINAKNDEALMNDIREEIKTIMIKRIKG